jgi:hypothetical protein
MFQVFYINVTKVYQDVAMMFQVYAPNVSLCFYMYVARVDLDIAYTCILQAYDSYRSNNIHRRERPDASLTKNFIGDKISIKPIISFINGI